MLQHTKLLIYYEVTQLKESCKEINFFVNSKINMSLLNLTLLYLTKDIQ